MLFIGVHVTASHEGQSTQVLFTVVHVTASGEGQHPQAGAHKGDHADQRAGVPSPGIGDQAAPAEDA